MPSGNGKVFTGRFGPHGSSAEVLFDRVCVENGIRHLLTAPRSPTTTGKVQRLHKTMRAEFLDDADRVHSSVEALQAAPDGWVVECNTVRPHQALGMRPRVDRFALVVPAPVEVVDKDGLLSFAGTMYRAGRSWSGKALQDAPDGVGHRRCHGSTGDVSSRGYRTLTCAQRDAQRDLPGLGRQMGGDRG